MSLTQRLKTGLIGLGLAGILSFTGCYAPQNCRGKQERADDRLTVVKVFLNTYATPPNPEITPEQKNNAATLGNEAYSASNPQNQQVNKAAATTERSEVNQTVNVYERNTAPVQEVRIENAETQNYVCRRTTAPVQEVRIKKGITHEYVCREEDRESLKEIFCSRTGWQDKNRDGGADKGEFDATNTFRANDKIYVISRWMNDNPALIDITITDDNGEIVYSHEEKMRAGHRFLSPDNPFIPKREDSSIKRFGINFFKDGSRVEYGKSSFLVDFDN